MIFNWQTKSFLQLTALRKRLPHALLLYGQEGIGKTHLARYFAQSLLCENPTNDQYACASCAACLWFEQGSHPDFRLVCPDAYIEEKESNQNNLTEAETTETVESKKESKKASQEIKVAQIRMLADFVNIASHRSGLRIILLYPAQKLNLNAANALLKMLEEPPAHLLFLLVANNLENLLPTIRSRCQKINIPQPDQDLAITWLREQGVQPAELFLAEAGGAPLGAWQIAEQEGFGDEKKIFFQGLSQPQQLNAILLTEKLYKLPLPILTAWMQRWLYDLAIVKACGKSRYYKEQHAIQAKISEHLNWDMLLNFFRDITKFSVIASHPLNPRVQLEAILLQYKQLFADKSLSTKEAHR